MELIKWLNIMTLLHIYDWFTGMALVWMVITKIGYHAKHTHTFNLFLTFVCVSL
jgi:hypothetical protein